MNRLARLNTLLFKAAATSQQQNQIKRTFVKSAPVLAGQAKDFKPGPYPKTEAERIAAAKKYNMRAEDYEPMADDGMGYGDYPKLGPISSDMKSDYEEWDDVYNKRNYGEPLVIYAEQVLVDKVSQKQQPWSKMLFMHFGGAFLFFATCYALDDFKFTTPIAPKQFPRNAGEEKHVTF